MRAHQRVGRNVERVGGEDQVGLVPREVFEHRGQHRPIGQAVTQDFGRESSQGEQPVGALLIGQDPAQGRQRQRIGVARMMGGFGGDCQRP